MVVDGIHVPNNQLLAKAQNFYTGPLLVLVTRLVDSSWCQHFIV